KMYAAPGCNTVPVPPGDISYYTPARPRLQSKQGEKTGEDTPCPAGVGDGILLVENPVFVENFPPRTAGPPFLGGRRWKTGRQRHRGGTAAGQSAPPGKGV